MPDVAARAGVDWAPPEEAAAPGPTSAQVADAADLAPADRTRMIRGMVEGLQARLDADGGPPEDWARLVTSLAVLNEPEAARAALAKARAAHAGDAAAEATLAAAGAQAGLE